MAVSYRETPFDRIVGVNWGSPEEVDLTHVQAAFNEQVVGWQPCSFNFTNQTPHINQASLGVARVGRSGNVRVDVDFVYFFELGGTAQLSVLVVHADGAEHRSAPTVFGGLAGFGFNQLGSTAIGPGFASITIEAQILGYSGEEAALIITEASIAKIRWAPGAFPP